MTKLARTKPADLTPIRGYIDLQPGIHLRGSHDYDALDAVNYSTLKFVAKSPKHYRHAVDGEARAPSRTMRRGSLVHTAVYEPDRLPIEYIVYPGERRGNAWKDFQQANSAREIVTQAEYEFALRIRDAVRNDPIAGPLVAAKGIREATLLWDDPATGIRCKGRPDHILDFHTILDLKTTRGAGVTDFGRDVARYSYHVQAALYADGYEVITKQQPRSCIIAVENVEPFDVVVYELDEATLGIGRDEYARWLSTVRDCRRDGVWPGYALGCAMHIELPKWARPDNDDLSDLGLEWESEQ